MISVHVYLFAFFVGALSCGSFTPTRYRRQYVLCAQKSTQFDTVESKKLGSGSYGTVHLLGTPETVVGKRAWTAQELSETIPADRVSDKARRCQYYWQVEKHCFEKLPKHSAIPEYIKSIKEYEEREWMIFKPLYDTIDGDQVIAKSLDDWMRLDNVDHKENQQHHLYLLSQRLGLSPQATLTDTIDVVVTQILDVLVFVHKHNIVHRDVKPSNFLVSNQRLVLIDFGSAADMDTAGILKANIGLSSERVALSPIYAAPETFVQVGRSPLNFDCFSAALLIAQLLLQYLDERTDAGFHQQLSQFDWSLTLWLRATLSSKVRPGGLEDALDVLTERPGLWQLLQDMLHPDPTERLSSKEAQRRWQLIQSGQSSKLTVREQDNDFVRDVLEANELCSIPTTRALHFVATFERKSSLGLILAEMDADTDEMSSKDKEKWSLALEDAVPGEVFVQGVVPDSQADVMGLFDVGDRLQGVGDIPLVEGGFETAVRLIKDQPRSAKYVTLHFDRKSDVMFSPAIKKSFRQRHIDTVDQGAWSSKGRRSTQEDAFILQEINNGLVLLTGVADGHLGTAASQLVQKELPKLLSSELLDNNSESLQTALESAWEQTCETYWNTCESGLCTAEYDPKEGILRANTGSSDAVPGTTTTVLALHHETGELLAMNCGDSRSLVIGADGKLVFQSMDHSPEFEIQRFEEGRKQGLDYSIPQCRMSRWTVPVGEYNYAVSRSLEGQFATSRGIVSTADFTPLGIAEPGWILLSASDGLWEVMDSVEVSRMVHSMRESKASDIAKTLCQTAIKKGSSDNVSCTIVML